jgi:hypothetical protein
VVGQQSRIDIASELNLHAVYDPVALFDVSFWSVLDYIFAFAPGFGWNAGYSSAIEINLLIEYSGV